MHDLQSESLEIRVVDGVAWVTFNRPDKLNAFTSQAYADVRDAVRLADLDPEIDVLVFTGAGRAFATGGDLTELLALSRSGDPLAMDKFLDNTPMTTIRNSKVITVAAVNGFCFAGGLVIAGLCDFVIASDDATFSLPESKIGLTEAVSITALFPKLGSRDLKSLALAGRRMSAIEAKEAGLVNEITSADNLRQRVDALVHDIRSTDRESRTLYKGIINDLYPPVDYFHHYSASFNIEHLAKFAGKKD